MTFSPLGSFEKDATASRSPYLSARKDGVVETLGIGIAFSLAKGGRARSHPGLHNAEITELARMAGNSLKLDVHGARDVHDQAGLLPLDQVDLPYLGGSYSGRSSGNERWSLASG